MSFNLSTSIDFPKLTFRSTRISAQRSWIEVRGVNYRAQGTQQNLLNDINLSFPEKSLGLIFGQSGSGKTTLLHLLAGLSKPTSGSICIQRYGSDGKAIQPPELLSANRVGIVFQFPERYFLADTILEEVTFGWPRQRADFSLREQLAVKLQNAFNSVGLNRISLEESPHSLSGGFKRRLALAIQLVETPNLLLLDEPLAGLDWKARADVVRLLKHLKKEVTLLVVSHDLKKGNQHPEEADAHSSELLIGCRNLYKQRPSIEQISKLKEWGRGLFNELQFVDEMVRAHAESMPIQEAMDS